MKALGWRDAGRVHAGLSRPRSAAAAGGSSEASGLHILSNTGYYGADKDKHLPPHAFTETPQQLAARWIRECEQGIDGTGIKPGFMKIGVDAGPLSEVDAKLVRAAAIAHKATGLPIAAHTGNGVAALEELDLLERDGVPLSAFIWVHAHSEPDGALHQKAAARGAWVEFDGIGPEERRPARRRSCWRCARPAASVACWCRTTPAGITSASRTAASSGRSTRCSPRSCRR